MSQWVSFKMDGKTDGWEGLVNGLSEWMGGRVGGWMDG